MSARRECADKGCTASYAGNRWESVRATNAGWFEQRDGTTWCPDHLPGWLAGWRAAKKPCNATE